MLVLALAVVLVAVPAGADELPSLADLGLKGQATFKSFTHFENTPNDHQKVVNEVILQVEWARRLGAWGSLKLIGEFRDDDFGFARGVHFQIPETTRQRSYLSVKEAVFAARAGPLEVTLGKQIFAWGTADAFNPTDNINPYDYLDVLDSEKIGVWSLAARASTGPASLVFVAVPFFTPSRLPLVRSRWTPPAPAGFQALVDDPVRPDQDAGATQYAARLKTTVAGWDVSVSYYDGFEHTLSFRQSLFPLAPGVFLPRLTPVYTREKVPGADFSTTFGKIEVHGEAAARFVESNGRSDRLQGIVGMNYTQDIGWTWLNQMILIVEYARETVLRHIRHSGIIRSESQPIVGGLLSNKAFRDAIVGRIQVKLTEDTVLKLSGIADLSATPSHYIQFKVSQRITDAVHAEAGLDFLTGEPKTFWGRWGDNDRFFVVLRYLF